MRKWNKKTYAKELKKGYWYLEPHFHYYSMLEINRWFRTIVKNKMNVADVKSALYGKFVMEGKPIKRGFYESFNLTQEIVEKITEKCLNELEEAP